jgi:hypothetical protein
MESIDKVINGKTQRPEYKYSWCCFYLGILEWYVGTVNRPKDPNALDVEIFGSG